MKVTVEPKCNVPIYGIVDKPITGATELDLTDEQIMQALGCRVFFTSVDGLKAEMKLVDGELRCVAKVTVADAIAARKAIDDIRKRDEERLAEFDRRIAEQNKVKE